MCVCVCKSEQKKRERGSEVKGGAREEGGNCEKEMGMEVCVCVCVCVCKINNDRLRGRNQ